VIALGADANNRYAGYGPATVQMFRELWEVKGPCPDLAQDAANLRTDFAAMTEWSGLEFDAREPQELLEGSDTASNEICYLETVAVNMPVLVVK